MKTKGKRQKQKPPLQPKTKCPTSEKSFTLFSSWKIQTTWVLPNPLLQPNQESGSAAISPLENYPSPCQHRPRPLDSRSPGCPWASHPDVIGSCLPVPSRAPGKFLQKSFHTRTGNKGRCHRPSNAFSNPSSPDNGFEWTFKIKWLH